LIATHSNIALLTLTSAIIALAGFSAYYLQTQSTSGLQSTSPLPPAACSSTTQIDYSSPFNPDSRQVLVLQPGVTTDVCVTYQANWANSPNFGVYKTAYFSNGTLNFHLSVYKYIPIISQCSNVVNGQVGLHNASVDSTPISSFTNCTGVGSQSYSDSFSVSILPGHISPSISTATFTVLFSITPKSNATGYYDVFGPAPGLLLSVGHTPSEIQSSDFPFAGAAPSLGSLPPYSAKAVSYAGASIVSLDIPLGEGSQ